MYVTFNLLILEKQIFCLKIHLFMLPRQPFNLSNSDKSLIKSGELFNKLFVKNKILLSPMRQ